GLDACRAPGPAGAGAALAGRAPRALRLRGGLVRDAAGAVAVAVGDHDGARPLRGETTGERATDAARAARHHDRLASDGHWYFLSSRRAIWARCTSSGPSARRSVRAPADTRARPKSLATPAAPKSWIARAITRSAMFGATPLVAAISTRAALLPPLSIM